MRVRAQPGASCDRIEPVIATADGPAVRVRVRAIAEDGAANAAVARTFADWIGVPKSSVAVSSGAKSRVKMLVISGDADHLAALIKARLRELGHEQ